MQGLANAALALASVAIVCGAADARGVSEITRETPPLWQQGNLRDRAIVPWWWAFE